MTKELVLSQGKVALVDDEDYEWANQWNWCAEKKRNGRFYAGRFDRITKQQLVLHREILQAPKRMQVDHINGDGLDNRRSNLRLATHTENLRNRGMNSNNRSGYKGVSWHKQRGKWCAKIMVGRRGISLGLFFDPVEAALAYDEAARNYFGEFAWTNFK